VRDWLLRVGSFKAGNDLSDSGLLRDADSVTVAGLPTDGSQVFVRLYYIRGRAWKSVDFSYRAAST
jgi:hypothetical protein